LCRAGQQRRRKDINKTATGLAGWSAKERGAGMRPAAASRTKEGSFVIYIFGARSLQRGRPRQATGRVLPVERGRGAARRATWAAEPAAQDEIELPRERLDPRERRKNSRVNANNTGRRGQVREAPGSAQRGRARILKPQGRHRRGIRVSAVVKRKASVRQ
jgi:hypothetical protein